MIRELFDNIRDTLSNNEKNGIDTISLKIQKFMIIISIKQS